MDGSAPEIVRVLVVDDAADVLNSTVALIERSCECDVRGCLDAAACLAIAEVWKPHLVLLDLGIPHASGFDIAELLKAEHLMPPMVVALTGYGTAEYRQATADAGFTYQELKPICVSRLRELVAEAASYVQQAPAKYVGGA
jgi:CheY-like chemotaxis protein